MQPGSLFCRRRSPAHPWWGRRLRAVAVALALSSAIAGCSASEAHDSAGTISTGSTAPASTGSGCGSEASPGSSKLRLPVDGHQRIVIVHVPTGYTGTTPVGLVLNMHGSGSDARQQEVFSGMDVTSNQDGFIVAYPQALIPDGAGFDWNIPDEPLVTGAMPPENAADDVAFLTQLPAVLAHRYCIDLGRVYATGVSGGGRMASQLACDSPGTFAAVAPVAGLRFPAPCATSRDVPMVAFHGTADPVDPYNGNGLAYWTYSVPVAEQRWAAHENCDHTTMTSGKGYELTASTGCAGGSMIELYSLIGEGHEWPGGPTMPASITKLLGPQTIALDANSVMWAFFSAHRLP